MANKNDDDDDKEEEEEDDEDDDDDDDVRNVVVRFSSFTYETTRTHTHTCAISANTSYHNVCQWRRQTLH